MNKYTQVILPAAERVLAASDDPAHSSTWTDRIALLMEEAGVPRSEIFWGQAPRLAAIAAVENLLDRDGTLASLDAVLDACEQTRQK